MNRSHHILAAAALLLLAFSPALGGCGTAKPAEPPAAAAAETAAPKPVCTDIAISEFMEKNKAVLMDEDGEFPDWAELYNSGSRSVSLAGWHISDREDKTGWEFPDVSIAPGERLLVFCSGKDRYGAELHTDFSLSGSENVYLRDPNGAAVYEAPCGGCAGDTAMAWTDEGWQSTLYPTPGEENSAAGYARFQQTLAPKGPLVINEAAVSNMSGYQAGEAGYTDWAEIKNISDSDVLLSDYYLSDDDDNYLLWQLPAVTLPAGGCRLILCADAPEDYSGTFNTFCGFSLDSVGEQLYLASADGTLLDYASLRDIPCDCSYGRMDGENGWFFFDTPTPGADNRDGRRRVASPPETLTPDGIYNGTDSLRVELRGDGEIRYTLDGSKPTAGSTLYSGPVELSGTCVLRAVSVCEDCICSRPLTLNYILNENHTLPVFCLNTDDPAGFQLMYDGRQKGMEKPASLSMYRDDGSFTIGCGVSLNGETSLSELKKNMSVRFRGAYGQEMLHYDIYGGGTTEFTNLLLRSGQDYQHAIIRNELAQNLCDRAGCRVINQRSIYGILYINGEYSGIYTLKEKANEQLYASLAGVERDSVELLEAAVPYKSDFYTDVISFVQNSDMTQAENYAHFCELVDIDSLIDWLFMEGFCANTDLASGNLRYCRSAEADGKWHLMFYDLDAAFQSEGSIFYNFMTEFGRKNIQFSSFAVPLMENPQFRDSFLSRAAELLSDKLTNEAVLAEIDRLAAEIAAEVPRDYGRYHMDVSGWEANLASMRRLIDEKNWRQLNIDALSFVFELSDAEREFYFGEIDGK